MASNATLFPEDESSEQTRPALSGELADAARRLDTYRDWANAHGYYFRHGIPGLPEGIRDGRPEISLTQVMSRQRADYVLLAAAQRPENAAEFERLSSQGLDVKFRFNADRLAFLKVTDAKMPEPIRLEDIAVKVPENLGIAAEPHVWIGEDNAPIESVAAEVQTLKSEPRDATEELGRKYFDNGKPSVETQIARGEAAAAELKALGNDPLNVGPNGVGVLLGEVDNLANMDGLRGEPLMDLKAENALNEQRLRESGGAILPDRLTDKAFDAASKLWNTDARADVAAQAGDVPEEKPEGWVRRMGASVGASLDWAADRFDAWTRRPELEEIARQTVTPVIVRAEEIGEALRLAREMKAQASAADVARIMESPGVDTSREAKWIRFKAAIQSTVAHPLSQEARRADRDVRIQAGIDSLTDRKADKLLKEHSEAVERIDKSKEIGPRNAHLLPAKEYQAALRVHQIDQRLRELRPESETVGEAHAHARGQRSERTEAPRVAETAAVRQEGPQLVQRSVVNERPYAAALEALTAYKDGAVRLEGWQKDPIKVMRKTLQDQLNGAASMEAAGRTPDRIDLSVKYNGEPGTNITTAREAHTAAIKANKDFIDLVRSYVPVDEGKVTFVSAGEFQKKSEAVSNGIGASA